MKQNAVFTWGRKTCSDANQILALRQRSLAHTLQDNAAVWRPTEQGVGLHLIDTQRGGNLICAPRNSLSIEDREENGGLSAVAKFADL